MSQDYVGEGTVREWNESCDPIGIELLMDWIGKNKQAVKRITVEYDPAKTSPNEGRMSYEIGGDGS